MLSPPTVRRRTVLAALAAAAATGVVQAASDRVAGSGPVRAQTRPLDAFTGIALALPAQLELRTGAAEGITIETNENLLPLIETGVENGSLEIRPVRRGLSLTAGVLKIVVTSRRVDSLSVAGTGAISAGSLRAPRLNLQVGGGGSIVLARIECDSLAASIAGASLIAIEGTAPKLAASIAGAGQLRAGRLKTRTANVSIIGAGQATVWAAGELNASVVGSGTVRYYGSPAVHAATVGSGSAARLAPSPS